MSRYDSPCLRLKCLTFFYNIFSRPNVAGEDLKCYTSVLPQSLAPRSPRHVFTSWGGEAVPLDSKSAHGLDKSTNCAIRGGFAWIQPQPIRRLQLKGIAIPGHRSDSHGNGEAYSGHGWYKRRLRFWLSPQ